ncbi:uncharacterized protein [Elaeis guineensis]|uniref:Peptidyl-tRNA hydrolase ICT1, mitochondrial isoform X2 n=1 Tax=Elaeis guineensis var. tenera TaxID=51953 RepID=A0A6I9QGR3_ELAGV|nr:peptidyl-tRNA hydrolase ICT1, mitochondrial isoform X2 [Elaeis guineensis]
MASVRSNLVLKEFCQISPFLRSSWAILPIPIRVHIGIGRVRCAAAGSGDGGKKVSARLSMMQQILQDAEERALSAGSEPTPKITVDHVTVSFARSGGPGGQNVNKVNTKVDMRFNVKQAHWLSERVRERILQMIPHLIAGKKSYQQGWGDCNFINKDKNTKAIIDAASYVPPPPSEEQKKKIEKLAAIGEQKRIQNKKAISQKKAIRRNKESWD